jgi:hypothetical protein
MVRWILVPEWVLDITIHEECWGDGKVDTWPRAGASYYHLNCWNFFLHDPPSHEKIENMVISSIFFCWTFLCPTPSFFM